MTAATPTTAGPPATTLAPPAPDGWVPADQRVAGFDRRTIWPGVVLLAVWVLWAHARAYALDTQGRARPRRNRSTARLTRGLG